MPQPEGFPEATRACLIALNTRMRRMEILRFRISDVNLKGKVLRFASKAG